MKICHIITRLVAGGAQRNTLLCAEDQCRRGHQVFVLSGLETGTEGSLLDAAGAGPYQWVPIPSLLREVRPLQDLQALMTLVAWLNKHQVDILHTHTSKAGLVGRLAGWLCGVPVVIHTPHGHVFHSYFSRWKTLLFKLCEKFLARFCSDGLVALSAGELKDHLDEGVGDSRKFFIIPSGVPLAAFLDLQPTQRDSFTIGYIGRLADIKGPTDLIEAMPAVLQEEPSARLVMVGDGPLRVEVERLIQKLNLVNAVRITGWREDTRPDLASMDLLVVPSHNEGMGRVAVEAMAAGVPVIATEVGGLPDLIQHEIHGLLVPPKKPQALATAIVRALREPGLRQVWSRNARSHARHFSDEVMFERVEQLYNKLFSGRRSG